MGEIRESKQIEITSKFKPLIKIKNGETEDVHYSLFYKDLPEEFKVCAQRDLNETKENMTKGMKCIKDIMERENISEVDDHTKMFFLRGCKYDLSKVETKFVKYHKAWCKVVRALTEIDLELAKRILQEDTFGFLPYRDKHGRAIFFTRHSLDPVITENPDDVVALATAMAFLLNKYSPITSVAGISSISCHKDIPLFHYYAIMKALKNHHSFWMNLPIRFRRGDIINELPFTRFFYKLIRPFTNLKSYERICFHGSDLGSLLQQYHPNLLPAEFGGNLGPVREHSFSEEMLNIIKIIKENPET